MYGDSTAYLVVIQSYGKPSDKVYPRGITSAYGTAKERHQGIVKQWGMGPGACRAAPASYCTQGSSARYTRYRCCRYLVYIRHT